MDDLGNAPRLKDNIRIFHADGGNTIAIHAETDSAPVRFQFDSGLLPILIGKLFDAADHAQKQRETTDPTAARPGDLRSIAAQRPKRLFVANAVGGNHIGLQVELSGVPLTLALTPEEANQLADWLRAAAAKQPEYSAKKTN